MSKTRVVIIGAGPGGYVAAIRGAQLGGDVTVIEDTEVGGTCLNRGCIPTKTLIASAEALAKVKHADEFGIEIKGEITFSMAKMMERKDKIVGNLVKGIRAQGGRDRDCPAGIRQQRRRRLGPAFRRRPERSPRIQRRQSDRRQGRPFKPDGG